MKIFLKSVLAFQAIGILSIAFDIPVLRQITGLVYAFFLPGLLILRITSLKLRTVAETILLSLGISVAFTMFVGLGINELFPLVGILHPLTFLPITITIAATLLALTFLGRRNAGWVFHFSLSNNRMVLAIVALSIVLLTAIIGSLFIVNWLLLLMVLAICLVVVVALFGRNHLPTEFYPLAILIIALSLIFQRELLSQNLYGFDVFGEFYVFKITSLTGLWNPNLVIPVPQLLDYNSMLSVTVLPTVLINLSNIPQIWIFKVCYFLIYIFVPLAIYEAYRSDFGRSIAFLSAFYFAFFPRFYIEERRQIIGELFLILLIFVILSKSLSSKSKGVLIGVFGISLIVSHYSISYIFIFIALFGWLFLFFQQNFSSFCSRLKKSSTKQLTKISNVLSLKFIGLFLLFAFFWYTFFSASLINTFSSFVGHFIYSLTNGFQTSAPGGAASTLMAIQNNNTLLYNFDFAVNKIPYVFIILGFLVFFINRKKIKIAKEYFALALGMFFILVMVLMFPSIAQAFLIDRYFHVSLLLLAPLCFYGGYKSLQFLQKKVHKRSKTRFVAILLVCIITLTIFLFKVGFLNQVAGEVNSEASQSLSYNTMIGSNNPQILSMFYDPQVPQEDLLSAQWLSHLGTKNVVIYADEIASRHVLLSYAGIIVSYENIFYANITLKPDSYVYLRTLNGLGYFDDSQGNIANMTNIQSQLSHANVIYTNGLSEICYNTP
jgi:uncharacterized membrane protein